MFNLATYYVINAKKNKDKEKCELVFYFFLLKYLGPTFTTSRKHI